MTFEEIKEKYAPQIAQRRTSIALAQSRLERLDARILHLTEEREQYRQRNGVITAHNADMWRNYTHKLTELNAQRNKAADELALMQGSSEFVKKIVETL